MSFSENLKQIRKDRNLSQEQMAELLDVSRQAVSKWESGEGYPEVEKLVLLSGKLNISLDSLMSTEIIKESNPERKTVSGKLTIYSPNENVIVSDARSVSSKKFKFGKNSPQYALSAIHSISSYWGPDTTFLAWYANEEQITKEMNEIQQAIMDNVPNYELKYSAKVERRFMKLALADSKT